MTGEKPAIIIGGQSDRDREEQENSFRKYGGPRFLVSSRAGGEYQSSGCASSDPRGHPVEPDGTGAARWPRSPLWIQTNDHCRYSGSPR